MDGTPEEVRPASCGGASRRPAPGPVCLGKTAKDEEEDFHDGGLGLGRNGHRHFLHAASAVVLGSAGCGCGTGGASPDGGRIGVLSEECVGEAGTAWAACQPGRFQGTGDLGGALCPGRYGPG